MGEKRKKNVECNSKGIFEVDLRFALLLQMEEKKEKNIEENIERRE